MESIDQLFQSYSELLGNAKDCEPDLISITAIASVLHSFYSGMEKIFLFVAKEVDTNVPIGSGWHKALLTQMTEETKTRKSVISTEIAEKLNEYLGFRHVFRNIYCDLLDWSMLEKLILPVEKIWTDVKTEINLFLETK